MRRESTQEVIERLLENRPVLSTRDVALQARVSRQMAQKLLKALVEAGQLTIEGRARAAKYRKVRQRPVDDSPMRRPSQWIARELIGEAPPLPEAEPAPAVDDSAPVDDFRTAALLCDFGSPYTGLRFEPRRAVLDVASAGSLYRLSARLLLSDVDADLVVLDFNGVMDVGDEFLEEIFSIWAPAHPLVRIETANVPPALRGRLARAKRE